MTKAVIGKRFYYATLILCAVIFTLALIFLRPSSEASDEEALRIRIYQLLVCFYAFSFLIPVAAIVMQLTNYPYDKKKMMIKGIAGGSFLVIGTVLVFVTWNLKVVQVLLLASLMIMTYMLSPTIKNNEKKV